jgi:TRAP transporter TAXI family solute receptor
MKRTVVWLSVALMVGLLSAGSARVSAESLPKHLNIGTHPVGAMFNVVGTAVATVVSKHTPMQMTVKALAGPTTWMPMMVTKEMDLGVITSADAYPAYLGIEAYEKLSAGKGFPVRLAVTGLVTSLATIVPGDSPAKKYSELKGLRVCGGYAGVPSSHVAQEAALANGGLTWKDVKMVPVPNPPAGVKAVIEGRADAAWAMTGMPVIRELAAKKGARFIQLDPSPEAVARKDKIHPYSFPNLIKAGAVPGVDVDTYMMGIEVYVLCRTDLPDNVVYEINKALWEHYDELGKVHPSFKSWNQNSFFSKKLFTPYHPGAIKFLKEKRLWTPVLEKRQQELLAMKK